MLRVVHGNSGFQSMFWHIDTFLGQGKWTPDISFPGIVYNVQLWKPKVLASEKELREVQNRPAAERDSFLRSQQLFICTEIEVLPFVPLSWGINAFPLRAGTSVGLLCRGEGETCQAGGWAGNLEKEKGDFQNASIHLFCCLTF